MTQYIKNLNIGYKLVLAFGLILTLIIILNVVSINKLDNVNNSAEEVTRKLLTKERLSQLWLTNTKLNITRVLSIIKTNDEKLANYYKPEVDNTVKKINEVQKQLEELTSSEEEKKYFEIVARNRKAYLSIRTKVLKLNEENKNEEAIIITDEQLLPSLNKYINSVEDVVKYYQNKIEQKTLFINHEYKDGSTIIVLIGVFSLIFSIIIGLILANSLLKPLKEALSVAENVTNGDLRKITIKYQSNDEIGKLLVMLIRMQLSLENTIKGIKSNSDNIVIATAEIAAGNMDLSSRTEQQAGSLEETASTMEELTATVKQNANNASNANGLAMNATQVAEEGSQLIKEVINKMSLIKESSKKVEEITSVIDSIAFQTNILALNAAVEAARAGEQGRGFAVVATEVRNLAGRSAQAAKEIKTLINNSVEKINEGNFLVEKSGVTMDNITREIKNVTIIMNEITTSSQEQSLGIAQINQAISEMDNNTQQNAALVEQAAAAAGSLKDQTTNLSTLINIFKLDDNVKLLNNKMVFNKNEKIKSPISKIIKKENKNPSKPLIKNSKKINTNIVDGDWEEF